MFEEAGDDILGQRGKGIRIAEEPRDVDEKIAEEGFDFVGRFVEVGDVGFEAVDLVEPHAPLDAAVDRARFVEREIVAGLGAEKDENFLQGILRLGRGHGLEAGTAGEVLGVSDQLGRHFRRRHHIIDQACGNGAVRHAVEFGGFRILRHDHAVFALDGAHAERAVGAGAGQNDADGALALVLGEGAEEKIDGQALSARGRGFEELQRSIEQRHVVAGRDDVGAIRLHHHAVGHFMHRHARAPLDDFAEDAFVVRSEVLDEDESHARIPVGGQAREKGLEGSKTSGRSSNPHHGEAWDRSAGGLLGSRLAPRFAAAVLQRSHDRASCPNLQGANGARW